MASKLSVFLVLSLSTLVNVAISQDTSHPACDASTGSVSIIVGNANLEQVSGRVGLPLILTCNVVPSSANGTTYTWLHNGQIRTVDTGNTLTFNPLTIADGGEYRCCSVIRLIQNETCQTEYSRTLTVTTPPRITSISLAVNVEVGQSIQLSCDAVGYPQPTFEWHKTGNEQEILSQAALYSVLSVNLSHSGVYVCRATNSRANVTDSVNVIVRNPPPPMTLPETAPETTTTARPTTQSATSNITRETPPTASSTGFYIGVAVISAVAVIFTALTALCFFVWVCYSVKVDKTVTEPNLVDEELTESQEGVDIEEAAFEETIGIIDQEIIPQPVKKKTRGKHHKF